jgi:3',5'-cyclic AMP phosphodiesterase CpdA
MYRNPVILHLSDLHFGRNTKPWKFRTPSINSDAQDALEQAIVEIDPRPDFIVVTGDVANRGTVKEMKQGRAFLEKCLNKLRSEGHLARCILIPGNHDAWRTTSAAPGGYNPFRTDRLKEWDQVFPGWSFLAPGLDNKEAGHLLPFSMLDHYRQHGGEGGAPLEDAAASLKAELAHRYCEFFPQFNLCLLKFDTNIREHRLPAHIARGLLGHKQRRMMDFILRDYKNATQKLPTPSDEARKIALVHHHVTRLPNVKLEHWMLMDDAGEVARWLAKLGVRLVLHGHYHTADLLGLTYWNTESNNSKVETIVVSAGSATARDVDDRHNSCHYINLGQFHTTIRRPRFDHGEYEKLAAAQRFEFVHKPELMLEEGDQRKSPGFLDDLVAGFAAQEKYADQIHVYTHVKSAGFIDKDRNYFGSVELEGSNPAKLQTNYLPFVFAAVGAQDFDECECQATDLLTDRPLPSPTLYEERPGSVFPCKVHLAKPLNTNDSFRVRINFRLKTVMLEHNDYDTVSLFRFPRGVAKLSISLISERAIVGAKLWELRGGKFKPSDIQLEQLKQVPDNPTGRNEAAGFTATVALPSALTYLLQYDKLS